MEGEIRINADQVERISKGLLKRTMNKKDTLVVDDEYYEMHINGREILNPNHEMSVGYNLEKTEEGYLLVINDGEPLPGTIHAFLKIPLDQLGKYLYLYHEEKGKYEYVDMLNLELNEITLDEGGTYLLSQEKLRNEAIPAKVFLGMGGVLLLLVMIYVAVRKKYWFW